MKLWQLIELSLQTFNFAIFPMVAVSLDGKMVNVCVCIAISTPTISGISQFFSGKKVTAPPSPKVPVRLWIQSNMRLNFDSWFKRRILHVPNWIEIMFNNLCLLEWKFKTRHSRSAILFGNTMRRLNQISLTYSFESTKISI